VTVAAFWYPSARGRAIAVVDLGTAVGTVRFLAIGQGIAPATSAAALGAVSLVSLAERLTTGVLSSRIVTRSDRASIAD